MPKENTVHSRRRVSTYQIAQTVLGVLFGGYLLWRLYDLFFAHRHLRTRDLGAVCDRGGHPG